MRLFFKRKIDESLAAFRRLGHIPHIRSLFDYGYVLLIGKKDSKGAIDSWEKLVKTNPNFDQLDRVKQAIEAVKEQSK